MKPIVFLLFCVFAWAGGWGNAAPVMRHSRPVVASVGGSTVAAGAEASIAVGRDSKRVTPAPASPTTAYGKPHDGASATKLSFLGGGVSVSSLHMLGIENTLCLLPPPFQKN